MASIFVTGATGYIGSHLIPELVVRGHDVRALVRPGSERKLVSGASTVLGDALDAATYRDAVAPGDTFVHLVGVAHPSPAKAAAFEAIDLRSIRAAVDAARRANVRHFIYLSVAQPAPAMKAYVAVRAEGERLLRESGIPATFIRPWYVLGPGHRWPYALLPIYWLWSAFPGQREVAARLYPVKLSQVISAIAGAVERPPAGVRLIAAAELRAAENPARPAVTTGPARLRS